MLRGANLLLRFLLELGGLLAAGYSGFTVVPGPILNWLVGIGLPLIMAAAWGIYRIPNDGGAPVITVGGQVRLALEAVFFAVAIGGLFGARGPDCAWTLPVLFVVNCAVDPRRALDPLLGWRGSAGRSTVSESAAVGRAGRGREDLHGHRRRRRLPRVTSR